MINLELSILLDLIIPLVFLIPIITAVACFVCDKLTFNRIISGVSAFILIGVSLVLASQTLQSNTTIVVQVGGWGAPLGIDLRVNGLIAVMILMSAVISTAITIYSMQYFSKDAIEQRFWPLWWFLIAAINGVFVSSDVFNTYIMLELLGLSAVSLIALQGTQNALNAAYQYLLVGLFGSLLYLLGVAILYRTYGVLDYQLLSLQAADTLNTQLALATMTLGMLMKCALFPLHFWLPVAHSNASAPVSAILSALVVKAAFFILFTLWFDVLSVVVGYVSVTLIGILGGIAVIYGSYRAFRAPRLKLLVAFSTVAQVGYLFLAFPLIYVDPELARTAVIYLIVAHGCAKAAMFMAAGAIQKALGHDQLDLIHGIATKFPVSIFIFAVTSASLIGLPPSGGFIAKWLLLNSAVTSHQWWWVLILFSGGLFACAYLFRVLNLAFTTSEKDLILDTNKHSETKLLSAAILSGITIIIGLNAIWITDLIASSQS